MAKSKAKDTKKNTADVGFEDQLWNAADVLRGNLDAAEYKNVVLGLIFLKMRNLFCSYQGILNIC